MQPLIDRDVERLRLEEAWGAAADGHPQLVVLAGPRRTGKTFLLSHFQQGRRVIWHTATADSETAELARLATAATEVLGARALDAVGGRFDTWRAALRFLAARAEETPLLVVIDEFPSLLTATPAFTHHLRDAWDEISALRRHHLMIALSGSAVTTVERELGGDAPLFGRATLTLRLRPVPLTSASTFLPDLAARDLIEAYATCGGFPLHLRAWDPSETTADNLRRLAGVPGSLLLETARYQLAELIHRSPGYGRVLRALGHERVSHRVLASRAGQDIQQVTEVLERSGVIEREVPVGTSLANTKLRLYRIVDPYLRFWFSVIGAESDAIEGGRGEAVLARNEHRWRQHVAAVFEDGCRSHAQRLVDSGVLPGSIVGRWWGTSRDPETRRSSPAEIDILSLGSDSSFAMAGEAKWGRQDVSRIARDLDAKLARIPGAAGAHRAVWARERTRGVPSDIELFTAEDVVHG